MLKGKTVVLGVTGSIAAYKIAGLASRLVKLHADVHVIMTKNATNFIQKFCCTFLLLKFLFSNFEMLSLTIFSISSFVISAILYIILNLM